MKPTQSRKRALDLECLQSGHYAVICTAQAGGPGHPLHYEAAEQLLRLARADLERVRPLSSHGVVIVDLPQRLTLSLVVPVSRQAALAGIAAPEGFPSAPSTLPSPASTAQAEAEFLAATAARVSKAAIDSGDRMVAVAEERPVSLEEGTQQFRQSPDEAVSRRTFSRASGPEQKIRYGDVDCVLGGGHQIPSALHSEQTFRLRGVRVLRSNRDGGLMLDGSKGDSEWLRLMASYPGCITIAPHAEGPVVQLLRLAQATGLPVDVEVSTAEKVATKKRQLIPVLITNRDAIISGIREHLELLAELPQ